MVTQSLIINVMLIRVVAVLCMLCLSACSTTYSAEEIEAWVVDEETGQPIEGVVVTANWQLVSGGIEGGHRSGQVMVMESVTDAKGRLYFPPWGPKSTPISFWNPLWGGPPHFEEDDPGMLFFKPGYKFAVRSNYGMNNTSSLRKSVLNGATIKIERFKGTPREYEAHLRGMNSFLMFMFDECYWQKTPKMILAVDQQYQQFRQNGMDSGLNLIGQLEGRSPAYNCGSVRAFLEGSQK